MNHHLDDLPLRVPHDGPFPIQIPVLALVASTGGLAALTQVLSHLTPDLPAAVLVLQHQSPQPPSTALPDILATRTPLPVHPAHDGDPLQLGRVLVAPPASHIILTPTATLALIATGEPPPSRPSADLLLATLAVTCGPRALAVILTGHGHDGQAGIRAIHRCGGTVLAQDEASAHQFGMPGAAIATGLVHATHPLPDLAAAITAHLTRT